MDKSTYIITVSLNLSNLSLQFHAFQKSSDKTKKSDTLLMAGDALAAEGVLLQNGLYPEAIMMNLTVYNWNRYFVTGCFDFFQNQNM